MVENVRKLMRDSAGARWTALVLLAVMMFFGYMFVDILSPLKSALQGVYDWDSATFGIYGSSEFFLNVFVGFLIIAGIILDKAGIRFTILLSASLMVVGSIIKFFALSNYFVGSSLETWLDSWWVSFPGTAKMASFGFMIFGCGCEMAGITVSKAIVKWFKGKELALAMGSEMAIARIGVAVAIVLAPIIANKFGAVITNEAGRTINNPNISAVVLMMLIFLVIGLICAIVYVFMDAKLDKQMDEDVEEEPEEAFRFSDLGKIFTNIPFLVIAALCVLYYSAIFPFQKYATNMLECNLNMETEKAAAIFFWFPIGAALLTPVLGNFIDRKGKGASMLMLGAILMFVCHLTFALVPLNIGIALTAIVVLGISFSLVPAALWPSVPKIIPNSFLGSAYAVIFWIQNIGLMALPIIVGNVLDNTNAPNTPPNELNYTPAMLVFASLGVLAFILSLILKYLDKKNHYGLEAPNIQKD